MGTNGLIKNNQSASVFSCGSKIFERIIHRQFSSFIYEFLPPYLFGYRKDVNTQMPFFHLLENGRKSLQQRLYWGSFNGLVRAFDTINHELFLAKLHTWRFSKDFLTLTFSYMYDCWQRSKINKSFSSWPALL